MMDVYKILTAILLLQLGLTSSAMASGRATLQEGQYYVTDADNMTAIRQRLIELGVDSQSPFLNCNPVGGQKGAQHLERIYRNIEMFERNLSRPIPLHSHICRDTTAPSEARTCRQLISPFYRKACDQIMPGDPQCEEKERNGFLQTEQIVALGKVTRSANMLVLFGRSGSIYTVRTGSTFSNCEPTCDANVIAHHLLENPQNFELAYAHSYDSARNRPSELPHHNWQSKTCRQSISHLRIEDRSTGEHKSQLSFASDHRGAFRKGLRRHEITVPTSVEVSN